MASRTPRYFLADLSFAVALCGILLALGRLLWRADVLNEKFDPTAYFFLIASLMVVFLAWGISGARREAPECVECGRRFLPPRKSNGPAICRRCRRRTFGPDGLRKERASGLWTIFVLLAILACFMGYGLSDLATARFGRFSRLALPLVAVGATLGLSVALFIAYVLFALVRNRMMLGEKYALAHARKVAGEEGEESSLGPVKLWHCGAIDPAPMLREQMETARGRFAAMVGEAVEVRGSLRIFCFARRDSLVAFHRQTATDLWNYDGIYGPARTLTLATEVVRHRTCDTEATARSLFALALLEQYKGFLPAPWLQSGINHALTAGEDGPDRLNRKMVTSLVRTSSRRAARSVASTSGMPPLTLSVNIRLSIPASTSSTTRPTPPETGDSTPGAVAIGASRPLARSGASSLPPTAGPASGSTGCGASGDADTPVRRGRVSEPLSRWTQRRRAIGTRKHRGLVMPTGRAGPRCVGGAGQGRPVRNRPWTWSGGHHSKSRQMVSVLPDARYRRIARSTSSAVQPRSARSSRNVSTGFLLMGYLDFENTRR